MKQNKAMHGWHFGEMSAELFQFCGLKATTHTLKFQALS